MPTNEGKNSVSEVASCPVSLDPFDSGLTVVPEQDGSDEDDGDTPLGTPLGTPHGTPQLGTPVQRKQGVFLQQQPDGEGMKVAKPQIVIKRKINPEMEEQENGGAAEWVTFEFGGLLFTLIRWLGSILPMTSIRRLSTKDLSC